MLIPLVVGPMGTNAYIFSENDETCYVIDPGGDPDKIQNIIEEKKLHVQGILCTHGHLDHTSAIGSLCKSYWEDSEQFILAIHKKDAAYLGPDSEETHRRSFAPLGILDTGYFSILFNPSPSPTTLLSHGDTVPGTSLEVLHTPGHTEGSISLFHRDEKILFSGDTLFSRGIGRADLPGGDMQALIDSIRNVLFTLPDSTNVYPGHGPNTDIGSEKKSNPFLRE